MERRKFIQRIGIGAVGLGIVPYGFAGEGSISCNEKVCREAWNKLCPTKGGAFQYVHPRKGVPNVLLYGDSISIGYTITVREQLKDKATVFRFDRNGGPSQRLVPGMEEMSRTMFQPYLEGGWDFEWDAIHFNVGLHDLKYLKDGQLDKENGKQVSSICEYKTKLDGICNYLMAKFPNTKLIFATTTQVPEGADGRFAGDSVKYNKAALEVMANHPSIVINDLYAYTFPNHEAWAIKPGNVHYSELGKSEQGKEVARIIAKNL
jgi:hypothetical protein